MFFPEKQPILCTEPPEIMEEGTMPPMFYLSERNPVQDNQLSLIQIFCYPVECTEPPLVAEEILPLSSSHFPERALARDHSTDSATSTVEDLLHV